MRDVYGNNALHLAVIYNAENTVIMEILSGYAEAIQHANSDRHFPLHLFIKRRHSTLGATPSESELVQGMVYAYGNLQHYNTLYAIEALKCGIDRRKPWAVRILIDAYPIIVTIEYSFFRPLRFALENNSSPAMIYMLLDANPAAARACVSGVYNIHIAIQHDTPVEVIHYMIQKEPESTKWVYNSSISYGPNFGHLEKTYLPVHLAAECGRKDVLQVLFDADPDCVNVYINESKWSALHFAVYGISSTILSAPGEHERYHARRRDTLLFLIQASEFAATRADITGCFPVSTMILLARKNPAYVDVVVRLIRAHVNTHRNASSELCLELIQCEDLMLEKTLMFRDIKTLKNFSCTSEPQSFLILRRQHVC